MWCSNNSKVQKQVIGGWFEEVCCGLITGSNVSRTSAVSNLGRFCKVDAICHHHHSIVAFHLRTDSPKQRGQHCTLVRVQRNYYTHLQLVQYTWSLVILIVLPEQIRVMMIGLTTDWPRFNITSSYEIHVYILGSGCVCGLPGTVGKMSCSRRLWAWFKMIQGHSLRFVFVRVQESELHRSYFHSGN